MKEPKEIYFLPVEQLSDDAIQCIEKVFELLDAIKDDCNINHSIYNRLLLNIL